MDLQLKDKTALVLAASKGIGRGIAQALAREGCRVLITSSNAENLTQARNELKKGATGEITSYVMDLTSSDSIEKVSDAILKEHPRVDILVTNGPGPKPCDALSITTENLDRALFTNLAGVIRICQKFVPPMIANKFGRIINLTSSTAKEPDEGMALSNITRAGVAAYSKTLSRELAKHGITANTILTGSVMTDRAKILLEMDAKSLNISYDEVVKLAGQSIPAGYISTPEQFAQMIVFLASPLSQYVNGVSLPIDGGYMRAI